MSLESFLGVGAALFAVGLYGALTKRNAIAVLMCLELMFNAVNITAVALSRYVVPARLRSLSCRDCGAELGAIELPRRR